MNLKLPEEDVPALREALRRGETTVEEAARLYRCSTHLIRHRTGYYKGKRAPTPPPAKLPVMLAPVYDPWKAQDADYRPNGEGPSEHPRRDTPLNARERKCLVCGNKFPSEWEGNRICWHCAQRI